MFLLLVGQLNEKNLCHSRDNLFGKDAAMIYVCFDGNNNIILYFCPICPD